MRQGWTIIAPLFGFSNFIMLIYLSLHLDMPIYIFAPVTMVLIVVILIYIGSIFMKKQQSTDLDLTYFKAKEAVKTDLIMWEQLSMICRKLEIPLSQKFSERKQELEEKTK